MPMAMRKLCQMSGFFLLISALFLALSVVSYSYDDPSWNYYLSQENREVHNLGGMLGAISADWAVETLGSTVFVLVGMEAAQVQHAGNPFVLLLDARSIGCDHANGSQAS